LAISSAKGFADTYLRPHSPARYPDRAGVANGSGLMSKALPGAAESQSDGSLHTALPLGESAACTGQSAYVGAFEGQLQDQA